MIVSFLFLINYVLKVVKTRLLKSTSSSNSLCKFDAIQLLDSLNFEGIAIIDEEVGLRFMPPAFSQRYFAVDNILVQLQSIYNIKKIVDIGCSELKFFTHIKRLDSIEEYIGVDIDLNTLERSSCRATPLNVDYLSRRCSPLKVTVLHGSATQPDERLKYTDAVIGIELIEHLFPPELDDLPFNIFGVIQPDVAIFTTPNADFNVLFKSLEPNKFRHYDHKFEWNRQQFRDWGHNLILRYPAYEVWFNGIGRGPDGTEELGCCSQIAVFVRKKERTEVSDFNVYYKTVHEVQYPYQTEEEKFNDILEYDIFQFIDRFSQNEEYLVGNKIEIPLSDILNYINIPCTEEKLKNFLEKSNKHVELINSKLKLVLPHSADDESSDSSIDGIINDLGDEESWIIDGALEDVLKGYTDTEVWANENWNYLLGPVEEMRPYTRSESDSSYDQTNDGNDFLDELDYLHQNCQAYARKTEQDNSAINAIADPEHSSVNKVLLTDEEDPRADSVTPVQDINVESNLQHSSSTSGNTSKSSDTLVDNPTMSPMNTSKGSINGAYSEDNYAPSSIKDSFSDKVQDPCSSSNNDNDEAPKNIPGPFHVNNDELPNDTKRNGGEKDTLSEKVKLNSLLSEKQNSENKMEHNIHIPSSSSVAPVRQPKEITGHIVKEHNNVKKQVHHDQSSSLVPRSQSLENVNMYKCKDKSFRYSLNIDNKLLDCDTSVVDMDLDTFKRSSIPSLTETYGSHSKAVDSGYPNSTQDMDLDLTPEQVDEIITETESSLEDEDSSADERVEPVRGNPPVIFADNVENGDVANNNRDGEGNNMEGGHVLPEELIFEDIVIGGEEVEAADQLESDDEGLFLSALDVSNETIIPEELSSNDDTVYLFDLPSPSSMASSIQVEEINNQNQNEFPSWLLNMEIWDDDNGSGDAGPDRDDSSDVVVDREGQVDFYPGDARAGGEPTLPED